MGGVRLVGKGPGDDFCMYILWFVGEDFLGDEYGVDNNMLLDLFSRCGLFTLENISMNEFGFVFEQLF